MTVSFTYYGHSTFGIDVDGTRFIVDPFFAPNSPVAPVTADQIECDVMLITHGHGDHIADAVSIAKRTGCQVIANFEVCNWLAAKGVENTHGMNPGGGYNFPFGRVKMTIAHHSSSMPDGSYGGVPGGFLVHFNEGTDIYLAGDTALTYDMRLIGEAGGVDVAALPIGDNFTMGPEDALTAAQFVGAKKVIPIHYNTWPPIAQDAHAFARALEREAGIGCVVMAAGESVEI